MSTHTAGPWEVVRHPHVDDELWLSVNQHADADGMKEWIAEIKYRTADEERQWADARLIAAAPEMFSALVTILTGFEIGVFQRNTDGDSSSGWAMRLLPYVKALADAQVAIARAEGPAQTEAPR